MTDYELEEYCKRNPDCDCDCRRCPAFAMNRNLHLETDL